MLRVNSWDHIEQEILISTLRRFGKTISVSMFCEAMMLSCPGVEISIYSTCKRISQKILRNVQKFALLIADMDYGSLNFKGSGLQGRERQMNACSCRAAQLLVDISALVVKTTSEWTQQILHNHTPLA